jgi:hypothetical protein
MLQGVAESPEFVDYISHGLFNPTPLPHRGEGSGIFDSQIETKAFHCAVRCFLKETGHNAIALPF